MRKYPRSALSLLLLFNLLFADGVLAQGPAGEFPATDESADGMLTIASEDDVARAVTIREVVYVTRQSGNLELKLISPFTPGGSFGRPPADAPRRPLIVYVQGSAWFAQDNSTTIPQMSDFVAMSGYVVASVQYRPSTVAKAPAQAQDVKSAIRFLRAGAAGFGIDPDRIAIWGDSSGGHMAALVGTSDGVADFVTEDNATVSSSVQAVVDFFGPIDFLQMANFPSVLDHNAATSPESMVIGGAIQDPANLAKVQAYNPITYIAADKDLPPFLIMHGDRDALVPFNQSVLLYEALKATNQDVSFYKLTDAGHETRFWTPRVFAIVKAFLDANL